MTNEASTLLIGRDGWTYNSAYFGYVHSGTGSTSNYATIGLWGQDKVLNVTAAGYVGIGTETPTEILDVAGKTKTTTFQMTTAPTAGYVLTSDASGNTYVYKAYVYDLQNNTLSGNVVSSTSSTVTLPSTASAANDVLVWATTDV